MALMAIEAGYREKYAAIPGDLKKNIHDDIAREKEDSERTMEE
jgi:hypothetical protein